MTEKTFKTHREAKAWLSDGGYNKSPRFTYDASGTGTYVTEEGKEVYATFYQTGRAVIEEGGDLNEDAEISALKALAGITSEQKSVTMTAIEAAAEKIKIQEERNIKPGTQEWFRLWFAKPELTGEAPLNIGRT